nr:PREDICTED: uncharacterized protein LOC103992659 isoform X2 [Musa acuminata subsp. malaccensis]
MGWRRRARIRRRMGILGRHDEQLCLLSPLQESGPTTTSRSSTPSIRSEAPRWWMASAVTNIYSIDCATHEPLLCWMELGVLSWMLNLLVLHFFYLIFLSQRWHQTISFQVP